MNRLLFTLCLASLMFVSCGNDDDGGRVVPQVVSYETDADVNAPIVACGDAFDVFAHSTVPSPTEERIVGLSFNGAGTGIAVGRDRNLYRVTENGANWERLDRDLGTEFLHSPFFANSETFFLVRSYNGARDSDLLRSDDRGATFRELPITNGRVVTDIHFENAEKGWAIVNTSPHPYPS